MIFTDVPKKAGTVIRLTVHYAPADTEHRSNFICGAGELGKCMDLGQYHSCRRDL